MPGTSGPTVTLIALDPNITTGHTGSGVGANSGFDLGLQGDTLALGTGGKLKQLLPMEIQTYLSGTTDGSGGAAIATIRWETAPVPSASTLSYSIWGSAMVFTANTYFNNVGKLPTNAAYIRCRITAYTSGAFTAYIRPV